MPTPAAWPVFLTGLTLSLSLIVAIGAQNTFVLRQGLRREHVGPVVCVCALLDLTLMTLGVSGLAAALGQHPGALSALGLAGAAVLAAYALQALRRALAPGALMTRARWPSSRGWCWPWRPSGRGPCVAGNACSAGPRSATMRATPSALG